MIRRLLRRPWYPPPIMMRKIIEIDDELCDGCGICIPNCVEGALKIIDGKARMISDLFCDGLGACLGHCPRGAIRVIEREAEPYDEWRVMERIVRGGAGLIRNHLEHMEAHGEIGYAKIARDYLALHGIPDPTGERPEPVRPAGAPAFSGCPGAASIRLARRDAASRGEDAATRGETPPGAASGNEAFPGGGPRAETALTEAARAASVRASEARSELGAWPVQLHLVNPDAPAFRGAHVLLAADCSAYAAGNFHSRYLAGKALAIACPKLDSGLESYREKLTALFRDAASVTVLMMEVPCCGGLLGLAMKARERAGSTLPISVAVLNVRGEEISRRTVL
mgnify:CR=1 FL=1